MLLGLGLSFVVACGAFGEGSTPDEPKPQGDAAVDDATVTPDASSTEQDGTAPPNDDAGIPPAKPCGAVFLCDDFERNFVQDPKWDFVKENAGGVLSISNVYSSSQTRSLSVALASGFDTDRFAYLQKNVTPKAARLTARFWLRTVSLPADADVLLANMTTDTGNIFLMFQSGKFVLLAQNSSQETLGQAETDIAAGSAHQITFDYRSVLGPKATALLDQTELVVAIPNASAVQSFAIGATYAQPGSGAFYYIDDVSLDRGQ